MSDQPNVLLIMTDQHRACDLGCYGNTYIKTPYIDRLAERAVVFDRFYVASPICMPNRATMITGRMPSAHGCRVNGVPLPIDTTTIGDLLLAAGYRTAVIGKCHFQNMMGEGALQGRPVPKPHKRPPPPGFSEARRSHHADGPYDQELLTSWAQHPKHTLTYPYYGFEYVELCIKHGDEADGEYARWMERKHPGSQRLRGPANALDADIALQPPFAWKTRVSEELYSTRFIEERTIAYLNRYAESGESAPFFLQCSFPDPHHPFTPPGRYWDMYDPDEMPLPTSFAGGEDPPLPHLEFVRRERDSGQRDPRKGFCLALTEREAREAIALSYGMITMIDDAVGAILGCIGRLGLDRNTIVIFTSDHGDWLGDHQLVTKGPFHYQSLIRIPFIWMDPNSERDGSRTGALGGSLDFAPTVLDRLGLQPQHGVQGHSLMGIIDGTKEAVRDAVLIEDENQRTLMGFDGHPRARTLVTEEWRATIYDRVPWGELYNLRQDPHEMHNLWDDPAYTGEKCRILDRLAREMMEVDDRSPFPSGRS